MKEKRITFSGVRCIGACGEEITEVVELSAQRLWSDPKSWTSGKVPVEGDEVHVESGWDMLMDVADTPVFGLVRVNGQLTFKQGLDITFKAKHIFVRAGELHIGSKEEPFNATAKIILQGEKSAMAIVYDNAIEAGNKLIANVNKIFMYGKPRGKTLTRLEAPANKGATNFTIEKGLDFVTGDRLALLTTSYHHEAGDYVVVVSYDNTTGVVQVAESDALEFYHWGA